MSEADPPSGDPSRSGPAASLPTFDVHDEGGRSMITSLEGIPALSLDAISSVAYGPEAMLVVLATAGPTALAKIEPITVAIVVLLVILVFSYRQVIAAYPDGGGSYAVSKDNLGRRASYLAGAALVVDYVLTVAVSIAAGVAALVSAFPASTTRACLSPSGSWPCSPPSTCGASPQAPAPSCFPPPCSSSGSTWSSSPAWPGPTRRPTPGSPPAVPKAAAAVGVLLILKAFAAGCSALTGVEAIANDVPAFRGPG